MIAYGYAEADPVNKTDPTGLFTSVDEASLVASIRAEMVSIQAEIGGELLVNAASGANIDLGPLLAPSLYDIFPDDANPHVIQGGFRTIVSIGWARRVLRPYHNAGVRRVFTQGGKVLRGGGKLTREALRKVWSLHPFVRGWAVEAHLRPAKG